MQIKDDNNQLIIDNGQVVENSGCAMNYPNVFVYGKKYRVVLAAEGVGIFDDDLYEYAARSKVLQNVLGIWIFRDFREAEHHAYTVYISYHMTMVGCEEFPKYFVNPRRFEVNKCCLFKEEMIRAIANTRMTVPEKSTLYYADR